MIDWDAAVLAPCQAVFGEDPGPGDEGPEDLRPIYARQDGSDPFRIDGIFDDAYTAQSLNADDEPTFESVNPVLGVRLAQFGDAPPVQSDKVTIPRTGVKYVVTDVHPDGHGCVKLILAESLT